jgi:hypothetical protein
MGNAYIIHEELLLNLLRDSTFNVRPTEQGSGIATNCARQGRCLPQGGDTPSR